MPKNKPSEETLAQVRRVIDALNERGARKQAIRLKVTRPEAPLPQTASKIGSRPYLPAGELPPTNEKGEPLGMIAQINCADLPENNIYPATGLLQFWMDPNDEECMWGFDYENPTSQKNFRVIYYETLGEPNPDVQFPVPFPTIDWGDYGWPLGPEGKDVSEATTEYALAFETWEQGFLDGVDLKSMTSSLTPGMKCTRTRSFLRNRTHEMTPPTTCWSPSNRRRGITRILAATLRSCRMTRVTSSRSCTATR